MKSETYKKLKEFMTFLNSHNIRMAVSSCGCCDGVSMELEINGEKVINDSMMEFNMFLENGDGCEIYDN